MMTLTNRDAHARRNTERTLLLVDIMTTHTTMSLAPDDLGIMMNDVRIYLSRSGEVKVGLMRLTLHQAGVRNMPTLRRLVVRLLAVGGPCQSVLLAL